MKTVKQQCQAKTTDGHQCKAAALPGVAFCFFHDPERAAERQEARSIGGSHNRMKTLTAEAPDVKLTGCQDVVALLSDTINQVRKGQVDPRVANAVGYLANVLIKAAEQGDLEDRVKELESILKTRGNKWPDLALTGTDS